MCATTMVLPGGDGTLPDSMLVPGFCVESGDKTYGTWNLTSLPTGGETTFAISATGSHSITFSAAFVDGGSYTPSYEVSATAPNFFTQLNADITQTMGIATLSVATSPVGTPPINFVKTANVVTSGNTVAAYTGSPSDLMVADTLLPIVGSDASAILNTFIQGAPTVPEPGTLELLGIALTGFGLFGLRRKSMNRK